MAAEPERRARHRRAGDEPAPIEVVADPDHALYGFPSPPEAEAAERRAASLVQALIAESA